jgi:hypothetical protein
MFTGVFYYSNRQNYTTFVQSKILKAQFKTKKYERSKRDLR